MMPLRVWWLIIFRPFCPRRSIFKSQGKGLHDNNQHQSVQKWKGTEAILRIFFLSVQRDEKMLFEAIRAKISIPKVSVTGFYKLSDSKVTSLSLFLSLSLSFSQCFSFFSLSCHHLHFSIICLKLFWSNDVFCQAIIEKITVEPICQFFQWGK